MGNPSSTMKPEFSDVIRTIIDQELMDLNVCLPGKVTKFNSATQYADVQIQLLQKNVDGSLVKYPVIPNVPVKFAKANGGKAFIYLPVKVGDDVILVFSQRSLDNWKTQGGMSDPADPRKHHLTDAFALLGGSALPSSFQPSSPDSVEVVNGTSKAVLHDDGTWNLLGGNGDDFIYAVTDLALGIQRATTDTLLGPEPLIDPEDVGWNTIVERLQAFTNGSDPYGGV